MNFKHYILAILLTYFVLCQPVLGFEDGFQNHPSNDLTFGDENNMWTINNPTADNYIEIYTAPTFGYIYNYPVYLYRDSNDYNIMKNTYPDDTEYLGFNIRHWSGWSSMQHHLYLYDSYDFLIGAYDLRPYITTKNTNHQYEFLHSSASNRLLLYIDGVFEADLGACHKDFSYWEIRVGPSVGNENYLYLDTFTTDGYFIGVGTVNNPDTFLEVHHNTEIDVEWCVKTIEPYGSWNDTEVYQIVTTWIDTGLVVNTTILNKTRPSGTIIYNRSVIMPGTNYGTYKFELTKDGTVKEIAYLSFVPTGSSGALSWDKSNYVPGEIADVTYIYSSFDPATYNYYIKTYNINAGLVDTHVLLSISGIENILIDDWATGSYYSLLTAKEKASGKEYSLAYDTFDVSDSIMVSGITYDVTNNISLGFTGVNFTQATVWYNTTSDINGSYELASMSSNIQITANSTKNNYTHKEFLFTPIVSGMYTMDLYLFPNNISRTTHAIEGVIMGDSLYQGIPNANVNIWNSTWSNNTISNNMGYYRFDGLWCNSTGVINEIFNGTYGEWIQLNYSKIVINSQEVVNITTSFIYYNNTDYFMNYTDGTIQINASGNMTENNDTYINYSYYLPTEYFINGTAFGHENSDNYIVTVNSWTIQNILLRAIYSLNITAIDSTTGAKIQEFTAAVDSESRDVINGTATYYKNYNLYTITVSSEGYYSSQENVVMDRNRDIQLILVPVDSKYYPSHYVEFIVCSIWGVKYPDVLVNVYNSTDTTGAPLLNGTTGANGGVTFRLDENVRYTLVFSGGGIVNKIINIYPRDNKYYIIVSYDGDIFEEDISESNIIGITVTHYPGINGSVDVAYNDILDNTSALNFTVLRRELMGNFTFVAAYDSFTNMSNGEHRFILTDYSDKEYVVIVNYTHAEYGDRQRNFGISYGNNIAVLNDIFNPFIKGMLSVFLLISVALIFSAANREIGAMIVSLTAAILHSMHWLDYFGVSTLILWAAISLALIVSIAANFGKKGKEEGY